MASLWGLVFCLRWERRAGIWNLVAGFAFLALATAAKLPFILFYAFPFGLMLGNAFHTKGKSIPKDLLRGTVGLALMALPIAWYAWVIPQWGDTGVIKGLLQSTSEDVPFLLNVLYETLLMTLPELLVNYGSMAFLLLGLWTIFSRRLYQHRLALPFGLVGLAAVAYFLFEINMITTIHDYYLFPLMPGIFLWVAIGVDRMLKSKQNWMHTAAILMLMILPITAGLRAYSRWTVKGSDKVLLENVEALKSATPKDGITIYGGDENPHFGPYHLKRKGWALPNKGLDPQKVQICLERGAQYLYANSREFEQNPLIQPHLDSLLGDFGGIRVWTLK
jgi:hypothetical protein